MIKKTITMILLIAILFTQIQIPVAACGAENCPGRSVQGPETSLGDISLYEDCDCIGTWISPISISEMIYAALPLFENTEGSYHTVVANDNDALSIGCLQWHASRALALMKQLVKLYPSTSTYYIGSKLVREIQSAADDAWDYRVLTGSEALDISRLLQTTEGVALQDLQAYNDIKAYVLHGRRLGITSPAALVYFCDIENQYGYSGVEKLISGIKRKLKKDSIDSVTEFHRTLIKLVDEYGGRRTTTYRYCIALGWEAETAINISRHPEDTAGKDGKKLTVSVSAEGTKLQYQWYFRTENSEIWRKADFVGCDSPRIKIPNTAQNRGREFCCRITDAEGNTRQTVGIRIHLEGCEEAKQDSE